MYEIALDTSLNKFTQHFYVLMTTQWYAKLNYFKAREIKERLTIHAVKMIF